MVFGFYFFDIAIVVFLFAFALLGFVKGFTSQVLRMGSWVLAVILALVFAPYISSLTREMITDNAFVSEFLSVFIVFILLLIVFTLVARGISGAIQQSAIGGIDRALGTVFSLVVGCILLSIINIGVILLRAKDDLPQDIVNAKTYPIIQKGSKYLLSVMPDREMHKINKALHRAKNEVRNAKAAEKVHHKVAAKTKRKESTPDKAEGYDNTDRKDMNSLISAIG